jgi:hypothetical protein
VYLSMVIHPNRKVKHSKTPKVYTIVEDYVLRLQIRNS